MVQEAKKIIRDIGREVNPVADGRYISKRDTQWTLVLIGSQQLDAGREVLGYCLIGAGVLMRVLELVMSQK